MLVARRHLLWFSVAVAVARRHLLWFSVAVARRHLLLFSVAVAFAVAGEGGRRCCLAGEGCRETQERAGENGGGCIWEDRETYGRGQVLGLRVVVLGRHM